MITVCAVGLYVGSFFMILLGQRLGRWEWVEDLDLDYHLDCETSREGIVFVEDRWMAIYKPLSSPIYHLPDDPNEKVKLNVYGKVMMTCYHWGFFDSSKWEDARDDAEKWKGWTGSEWFPDHYEWEDTGENRYPLPN